jgi:hypothetical protein
MPQTPSGVKHTDMHEIFGSLSDFFIIQSVFGFPCEVNIK